MCSLSAPGFRHYCCQHCFYTLRAYAPMYEQNRSCLVCRYCDPLAALVRKVAGAVSSNPSLLVTIHYRVVCVCEGGLSREILFSHLVFWPHPSSIGLIERPQSRPTKQSALPQQLMKFRPPPSLHTPRTMQGAYGSPAAPLISSSDIYRSYWPVSSLYFLLSHSSRVPGG